MSTERIFERALSAHNRGGAKTLVCLLSACLAFAAQGAPNVFDDAVFWFRGGKDCVAKNGYLQQGEFFDDLHADDASHVNHQMGVLPYNSPSQAAGFRNNAEFRLEKVVFPALGRQIQKNMPVLHLSNNSVEFNSKQYYWPQYVKPYSLFANNGISNEYTVVSRLRLDEDGRKRTQCLLRIGYSGSAKKGLMLGFSPCSGLTNKYITAFCTPSESSDKSTQVNFDSIEIPTNTWVDVAVVVGNGKLRIGVAAPQTSAFHGNNSTIAFAETNMWTANCTLLEDESCYRLFAETGQDAQQYSSSAIDMTFFLGSVQQMAIWKRALGNQDVMAAFGMPRPAIFRTGFDNGASNEFGGTRSGSSQEIDGLGSWQNIANTMQAGDTWTVSFTALRDEAGLPQIFSIKALDDSVDSKIEPILNDSSLGERRVATNGRTFWPVPAGLINEGANTLVVKRKDDGAGDFKMDAMELGGSLGVGKETGDIKDDQRTSPERMKTGVPSAADPNTQHWPQGLMPSMTTNLHFRVWVDPDVVDKVTSRFWTHTKRRNATQETELFALFVNNDFKTNSIPSNSWEPTELTFQPGELKGGWNDFEFISAYDPTYYWEFGYFRFETVLQCGFSLPPLGLSIILR